MINDIKVEVFKRNLLCDICGKEMKYNGSVLASSPPKYPHYCECGEKRNTTSIYPKTIYPKTIYPKTIYK